MAFYLQGVSQDPEPLRVSGELEYPEDSEYPECDEGARDLVVVVQTQADVVGHDGHEVDHRHHGTHELATVRGCTKTTGKIISLNYIK